MESKKDITGMTHKAMVFCTGIFLMGLTDLYFSLKFLDFDLGGESNPFAVILYSVWGELGILIAKMGITVAGCVLLYIKKDKGYVEFWTWIVFLIYLCLMFYWAFILYNPKTNFFIL